MAKKNKVPKKIAGVKLPKPLRRGLRDMAASQNGRTVLMEAVAAAGAALAAAQSQPGSKTRRLAAKKGPEVKARGRDLRRQAEDARSATAAALADAARSFTEALRRRGGAKTPTQTAPTPPSPSTH